MTQTVNSFAADSWRSPGAIASCSAGGWCVRVAFSISFGDCRPIRRAFIWTNQAARINAYTIATTGRGEFGDWFPVYPQFYTESNVQYSNSVHIYLMSLMYLFVPPSTWSARLCSLR